MAIKLSQSRTSQTCLTSLEPVPLTRTGWARLIVFFFFFFVNHLFHWISILRCNHDAVMCSLTLLCLTNLFNQGLQFDLSSATFIRMLSLKKKKAFLKCIIYTYDFVTTQISGLIFWLTLEILTTLNSGCVNNLETKCWIDARTYANQIHCVRQHSLTYRHCVLVYICEISG